MLDHISITVSDIAAAFWDAGVAAGGSDDGPLGLRNFHASYYAAFLRDRGGNRIEADRHHSV